MLALVQIARTNKTPMYNRIFNQHWNIYKKILKHNYMGHRQIFDRLRTALLNQTTGHFTLLDIGCGDSQTICDRLKGTSIRHYTGIDLSRDALDISTTNLNSINLPHELIQQDFTLAIPSLLENKDQTFDVIFAGFALHHLQKDDKAAFISQLYSLLNSNGCLFWSTPTGHFPKGIFIVNR